MLGKKSDEVKSVLEFMWWQQSAADFASQLWWLAHLKTVLSMLYEWKRTLPCWKLLFGILQAWEKNVPSLMPFWWEADLSPFAVKSGGTIFYNSSRCFNKGEKKTATRYLDGLFLTRSFCCGDDQPFCKQISLLKYQMDLSHEKLDVYMYLVWKKVETEESKISVKWKTWKDE